MSDRSLTVRFWGVRGSLATSGPDYVLVGGNTSCVEVRVGDELIILDAGTGLFPLGATLPRRVRATVLLSHYHWDHIQGFPLFRPAYEAGNTLRLCGPGDGGAGIEAALRRQMQPPHFPVSLDALPAAISFRTLRAGDEMRIGAARVHAAALNHPQECLGYRIEVGDLAVVYATDNEQVDDGVSSPRLLELAGDADLLILDAQYTDDEYEGRCGPCRRGWGHSTVTRAAAIAARAKVRRLALFHHDPTHTDEQIFRMVREARAVFPRTTAACEGETIEIGGAAEAAGAWFDAPRAHVEIA